MEESQYNSAIDKFITYQFEPHKEEIYMTSADSLWFKGGKLIVEVDVPKKFIIDQQIWKSISSMFSLSFKETTSVIETWLETHYPNFSNLTPTVSHRIMYMITISDN